MEVESARQSESGRIPPDVSLLFERNRTVIAIHREKAPGKGAFSIQSVLSGSASEHLIALAVTLLSTLAALFVNTGPAAPSLFISDEHAVRLNGAIPDITRRKLAELTRVAATKAAENARENLNDGNNLKFLRVCALKANLPNSGETL